MPSAFQSISQVIDKFNETSISAYVCLILPVTFPAA
jgi:hypothetical protein